MSKCEHFIDISPHDPLCDHPCRLYGGEAVEAECETCQYRIEDLERENAKLRELCRDLDYCRMKVYCVTCPHGRFCDLGISERLKELEVTRRND